MKLFNLKELSLDVCAWRKTLTLLPIFERSEKKSEWTQLKCIMKTIRKSMPVKKKMQEKQSSMKLSVGWETDRDMERRF